MSINWASMTVGFVVLGATAGSTAEFAWRQEPGRVALVQRGGAVVWQFNHATNQAMPYFHPLALPGEPSLTWLSPPDHPWHYGLWFAWKFLNGKNYWDFNPQTGRFEGTTSWSNVRIVTHADLSARIELDLVYGAADGSIPVLRERRRVEVSTPANDGSYRLDWTMTFTASDRAVVFERTPIPGQPGGAAWGGYAGLTVRVAKEMTDWQVVNARGARGLNCHGQKAVGCDFQGQLGGKEAGVALLDHAQNLQAPTPWYVGLDAATPFGCLIAAPLFTQGHTLEARQSFALRYRVIVHPRRWDAARLSAEFATFCP
jgi:hypothetical protein